MITIVCLRALCDTRRMQLPMKVRHWLQNVRQQHAQELVLLVSVLVLATTLRLVRLPDQFIWNGDTARDIVVAKHLWEYNEPLELGHSAYGLRIDSPKNTGDVYGMSHYPTYYFRLMALLWGVTKNVYGVAVIAVGWQILGLAILYYGLRQLAGKWPAVITIGLISVSVKAIEHSLGVAIHPAVPYFFLLFTLTVLGIQRRKLSLLGTALGLALCGVLVHYSFLICFGWILGLTFYSLWKRNLRRDALAFVTGAVVGGGLLFFFLHLEVIRFYGLKEFIGTFTGQYQASSFSMTQLYPQFADIFLRRLRGVYPLWTTVCVAVSFGLGSIAYNLRKDLQKLLLGLAGFGLSLLILGALKVPNTFHYEQVVFVDYVVLILNGISLGVILESRKTELSIAAVVLGAVLVLSSTQLFYRHPPILYTIPITAAQQQAEELLAKNPQPLENTEFFVSSYYSWDYESPTVIYWLEELSGKKLIELTEVYDNIAWPQEGKTHMIASCQRYARFPAMEAASCQNWLRHFEDSGKYVREKELFSNEHYRAVLYRRK